MRAQRLIRRLVPAKTVNRLVTKRLHQQAGTLWKAQRDRETVTRVLLSGTRLSKTLGKGQRDREMVTRMEVGERLWEATVAGIHPLAMPVGAATMTGTPMAPNSGRAAQTTLGGTTTVMIMAVVGHPGRRREGSPKEGSANTTRMATAGRVRSASTSTVDLRGSKTMRHVSSASNFCIGSYGHLIKL